MTVANLVHVGLQRSELRTAYLDSLEQDDRL